MEKIKTRAELAAYYDVSIKIITGWLKEIKSLEIKPYQKVFTPKQISKIIEFLGTP
jgi:hypothetical protein